MNILAHRCDESEGLANAVTGGAQACGECFFKYRCLPHQPCPLLPKVRVVREGGDLRAVFSIVNRGSDREFRELLRKLQGGNDD